MRLLQIVPAYASYDVFLRELAETAVKAGHPTAVVCGGIPGTASPSAGNGVQLLPLEMPRGSNVMRHWMAGRSLRRLIEAWRADVVHAHFSAGMFSAALAFRRGDPWITFGTFQGLSFPLIGGRQKLLVRMAETFAARRFDRVYVLTSDDLEALRRVAPSAPAQVQPGYGFGCADRFLDSPHPSAEQRRTLRRAAGIPEAAAVLIFVGRLVAFKGFDLAVRSFWRLAQETPQLRLVVLGEVDPLHSTGLSAEEWQRYSNDPGIVRAGVQADVMPWLDLADLMVFPTEREGMPVCVMEALARSLPVVTTLVRGCRELIVDGQNGFFVGSRSEAAWSVRLSGLIRTTPAAVCRKEQPFSRRLRRSLWVADTVKAYTEALAARHPSRVFEHGQPCAQGDPCS